MSNTKKSTNHYVNNETMYNELKAYRERVNYAKANDKQIPKIPDYIGECFMQICEGLSKRLNFAGYSFREEMVSDAIENCVVAVHNFDCDNYDKPFAYFTQIAWWAFLRRIQAEKKQQYIKHKNYLYNLEPLLFGEVSVSNTDHDSSNYIIEEFEKKYLTKKETPSIVEVDITDINLENKDE